jgi:formylglycine-generating enzyme required for sulfatase activity
MKLKLVLCTLAALAVLTSHAADARIGITNQVSNKISNATTNQPSKTVTNQLPQVATNAISQTVTNTAPKMPGETYTNSLEMEFVKVSGFWAGRYEVTQKEFQKVMASNPSAFNGDRQPVDNVSWNDAMEFCRKLTETELKEKQLPEGFSYTLPTEGQWEGLVGDANLENAVTSTGGPRGGTSTVGSLAPNKLGLYDVRGNVLEFCLGDPSKAYRVLRGGSWQDRIEVNLRLEFRNYVRPDEAKDTFGFRCILVQSPGQ